MKRTSCQLFAFASLIALSACSKEKKEAPVKVAAADTACPSATVVTSMKFEAPGAGPLAIAPEKFTFASARLAKAGKLQIFIATKDWPIAQLGLANVPIESAEDAYLNLTIRSEELAGGKEYAETGKLKSPISTTLFTKNLASGVHTAPPSTVKILAYSADSVCGEFDLQGIFDGESTKMVGTFVAPIAGK